MKPTSALLRLICNSESEEKISGNQMDKITAGIKQLSAKVAAVWLSQQVTY
jgi:hypothetical protein